MELLTNKIKEIGREIGFEQIGITDIDLSNYTANFLEWLQKGFHGEMHYMEKHGSKRYKPEELVPGTLRVISVRKDYFPPSKEAISVLNDSEKAYISRYALGNDYHRLMRKRLQAFAEAINALLDTSQNYRVFTDSAPVLEKPLAEKAGLGWIGKNTNLLNSKSGSYFFLGEIFTNLPLPLDQPLGKSHCGSCRACIDVCPTHAIVAPYQLDARRCISYLTIELRGSIPVEFRRAMGNRIYGCDDCQLFCPWNKFAKITAETAFHPRSNLDSPQLLELFAWTETEFLTRLAGSAIRRIGYECWLRNIAIALGNAPYQIEIINALQERLHYPSELVREHVTWALQEQFSKS